MAEVRFFSLIPELFKLLNDLHSEIDFKYVEFRRYDYGEIIDEKLNIPIDEMESFTISPEPLSNKRYLIAPISREIILDHLLMNNEKRVFFINQLYNTETVTMTIGGYNKEINGIIYSSFSTAYNTDFSKSFFKTLRKLLKKNYAKVPYGYISQKSKELHLKHKTRLCNNGYQSEEYDIKLKLD